MLVERVLLGARGVVGNDGERALVGDRLADMVGVIGGVGHDDLGGEALHQGAGLRRIASLAGREDEAHRAPQAADSQMDIGYHASSGARHAIPSAHQRLPRRGGRAPITKGRGLTWSITTTEEAAAPRARRSSASSRIVRTYSFCESSKRT